MIPKQRQELIDRFMEITAEHVQYDDEIISQTQRLGEFGFSDVLSEFRGVSKMYLRLRNLDLTDVPEDSLRKAIASAQEIATLARQFRDFDPNVPNPGEVRNGLLDKSKRSLADFQRDLATTVAIAHSLQDAPKPHAVDVAAELTRAIGAEIQTKVTELEAFKTRAEAAVTAIEANATKAGIYSYATNFKTLADQHALRSYVLLSAAFAFAFLLLCNMPKEKDIQATREATWVQFWAQLAPHAGLPLFFLFGVIVATRLFAAERHNSVVNRQRQAAFTTFEAFVAGAHEERTKDAILLQAASAVFAHQPSGYSRAPIEVQSLPIGVLGAGKTTTDG